MAHAGLWSALASVPNPARELGVRVACALYSNDVEV